MYRLKIRNNAPKYRSKESTQFDKQRKINKFNLKIIKKQLVSNSGTLKKKYKDNLKLFDDILKSELMIDDPPTDNVSSNTENATEPSSCNNNNYQSSDKNDVNIVTKTIGSEKVKKPIGKLKKKNLRNAKNKRAPNSLPKYNYKNNEGNNLANTDKNVTKNIGYERCRRSLIKDSNDDIASETLNSHVNNNSYPNSEKNSVTNSYKTNTTNIAKKPIPALIPIYELKNDTEKIVPKNYASNISILSDEIIYPLPSQIQNEDSSVQALPSIGKPIKTIIKPCSVGNVKTVLLVKSAKAVSQPHSTIPNKTILTLSKNSKKSLLKTFKPVSVDSSLKSVELLSKANETLSNKTLINTEKLSGKILPSLCTRTSSALIKNEISTISISNVNNTNPIVNINSAKTLLTTSNKKSAKLMSDERIEKTSSKNYLSTCKDTSEKSLLQENEKKSANVSPMECKKPIRLKSHSKPQTRARNKKYDKTANKQDGKLAQTNKNKIKSKGTKLYLTELRNHMGKKCKVSFSKQGSDDDSVIRHNSTRKVKSLKEREKVLQYECHDCEEKYKSKLQLRKHILYIHLNSSIAKPASAKVSETRGSTRKVKDSKNMRILQYECHDCKEIYKSKPQLRKHILYIHLNTKPFACSYCNKRFRQSCNLEVHLVQKHIELTNSPEKFICDLCNKSFLLKENLSLHLSNHTKGIGFYKCAFCDKKFSNHFFLTEHEKNHLMTTKKYLCSICDLRFYSRSKLASHVKNHINIKDFVCQYCGKEFLRPNSIRRHVEICHSGFRIQCPICCKKLKGHLSEHLRTHENSKPHKCPDCGQRFTQSTQLTVHRRSHTGAKPYSCRICGHKFTHSNAMLLHFRRHTGEKPFQCAMCPSWFSQLPHMKTHMKTIHGKTEAYKCQKCEQFFKLKKLLNNHSKTCTVGCEELSLEEKRRLPIDAPELDSVMNLSRMRFLLALLLTMVASKSRLKCLGFNKRLIDDLLIDSLEAMGHKPCKDNSLSPLKRLKLNIDILLTATIPVEDMMKIQKEKKTTEEILELLTDDKTSCAKILWYSA